MNKYKEIEVEDLIKSELKEEYYKKKDSKKEKDQEDKNLEKKISKEAIKSKNSKDIDNSKDKKEKKNLKKSNNFNFEEIEKEDVLNQILYISYNNNNNYISLGTLSGFKIFSLFKKHIELIYQFQYNPIEPVKIIEMVNSSQLVLLVGKNETNHLSPKKLSLFDLGNKKIIYSLNPYSSEIKLIRLNKKRIIVYADKTIFIYNLSNMKLLHTLKLEEDIINEEKSFYQGKICLSPNSEENNYLIYSISQYQGLIKIYDVLFLTYVNFFIAHKNPLFKMCINSKGDKLATCSKNNGTIKIFSLPRGDKLFKFQRGYTYNTITGMNFNILGNSKLVVSSGSGNIHIFDLDKPNKKKEKENITNKEGYLNKINQIYQKVSKECKDYLNNKNLTTTVNIKDLKGENLLFFKEGKGSENKNTTNIIAITLDGFFYCINIDIENYSIINIYQKYIDSIKLKNK